MHDGCQDYVSVCLFKILFDFEMVIYSIIEIEICEGISIHYEKILRYNVSKLNFSHHIAQTIIFLYIYLRISYGLMNTPCIFNSVSFPHDFFIYS